MYHTHVAKANTLSFLSAATVYPQKQQYPSYGYGYPGPYHYGSQYGPYNY